MSMEIYEIPGTVQEMFEEVEKNDGEMSYRIVNYGEGMSMDNNESMQHFLESVDVPDDLIEEDLGTQVTLKHPDFKARLVIDASGLGDFFSHGFDCSWHEDDIPTIRS